MTKNWRNNSGPTTGPYYKYIRGNVLFADSINVQSYTAITYLRDPNEILPRSDSIILTFPRIPINRFNAFFNFLFE